MTGDSFAKGKPPTPRLKNHGTVTKRTLSGELLYRQWGGWTPPPNPVQSAICMAIRPPTKMYMTGACWPWFHLVPSMVNSPGTTLRPAVPTTKAAVPTPSPTLPLPVPIPSTPAGPNPPPQQSNPAPPVVNNPPPQNNTPPPTGGNNEGETPANRPTPANPDTNTPDGTANLPPAGQNGGPTDSSSGSSPTTGGEKPVNAEPGSSGGNTLVAGGDSGSGSSGRVLTDSNGVPFPTSLASHIGGSNNPFETSGISSAKTPSASGTTIVDDVGTTKKSNTGAIVGGILGALAILTLLILAFVVVRRRRRRQRVAPSAEFIQRFANSASLQGSDRGSYPYQADDQTSPPGYSPGHHPFIPREKSPTSP